MQLSNVFGRKQLEPKMQWLGLSFSQLAVAVPFGFYLFPQPQRKKKQNKKEKYCKCCVSENPDQEEWMAPKPFIQHFSLHLHFG